MNRERISVLEAEYLKQHPASAGTVEPFVFKGSDNLEHDTFLFPIITPNLLSEDWEQSGIRWFVDTSGFGTEMGLALTMKQFRAKLIGYIRLHPGHGFGLIGVGSFQVNVSAYRKVQ